MKNRTWKKAMAVTLGSMMILSMGTTVSAVSDGDYTKNENVYVALDSEGKVSGTHVVNIFHVTKEGDIIDYGDYDKVVNLTNLDEIESDKEEHNFYSEEGKFYYQGDMSDVELPWLIDIDYYLDDEEMTSEELAGQSGDFEMHIRVKENPQASHDEYYNNYMLQISVPMDTEVFDNTICEGGIISDAGKNEQVTFVVSPGSDGNFKITAEVENFELDSITMNGVQQVYERPKEEGSGEMKTVIVPSFTSSANKTVNQVMFLMSTEGIKIPEPPTPEIVENKESKWKTFKNKLISLFE